MSTINQCKFMNTMSNVRPYIRMHGDEYFKKSWFSYKPITGPHGVMSSGAMTESPQTKFKRGEIFTRRGSEYIPGWGTVAGNLTMTPDFEQDLKLIMDQPDVHGVFWVNKETGQVEATWFVDDDEHQIH